MVQIKTYVATLKIIFDALESENPRVIAKNMTNTLNSMRGSNMYADGVVEKVVEETKVD